MKGFKEVLLFDSPQAHGFCPREKSCPFSHDVDDVLDREWKARESKRQKRKRKQKSSGNGCVRACVSLCIIVPSLLT